MTCQQQRELPTVRPFAHLMICTTMLVMARSRELPTVHSGSHKQHGMRKAGRFSVLGEWYNGD